MGCDIVQMLPSEDGISLSYSTFNHIRCTIVDAYLETKGVVFDTPLINSVIGITSFFEEKMNILEKLANEGERPADGILVLHKHSDCDGHYDTYECECIAEGMSVALSKIDKEDVYYDMILELYDLFRETAHKDGILEVF